MPVQHVNFYENQKEAAIRLHNTIVMYDGEPYYVLCICDHKPDDIIRLYLSPIGDKDGMEQQRIGGIPFQSSPDPKVVGQKMDEYLDKTPSSKIIRKMMNSPLFNKFRPFPLGMCNTGDKVYYTERGPTRATFQGLNGPMLHQFLLGHTGPRNYDGVYMYGPEFRDTILGRYPSAHDVLEGLRDKGITNEGAAFHREFAIMRGPMNMLFLAYKHDFVGLLLNNDFSTLKLNRDYVHCREVISDLGLFYDIVI